jgi:polyisoprenyl-teichoic acid--peptidoglycan teichoic acid transferase
MRGRGLRRWLASLTLLGSVAVVGGGPLAWAAAQSEPVIEVHKVDEGHYSPRPGEPVFMLALGVDGRPGIDTDRADAIHVVGVNAAAGSATILNIPRDTYVPIPGHGRAKINDAYTFGGPELQARVVSQLTGVQIRFVITTTFDGFPKLVDEIGGMPVGVDYPMNDRFSGANFPAGIVQMNGAQAFAFSRNRHVPDGDIARSTNQGKLIIAALAKLRGDGVGSSPAKTFKALGTLGRHTKLTGVSVVDLYNLGRLGLAIDPGRVRNVTMPSSVGMAGSMSVVFVAPAAGGLFADFRDDAVLQAH